MRPTIPRLAVPVALVALVLFALVAARASATPQACTPSTPALKILVDKDGWYRTTVDSTCYLTADPNVHLSTGGPNVPSGLRQDVPFKLNNGTLEFYGQALDTSYTDTRTYWLWLGTTPGLRMQSVSAGATPSTPSGTFEAALTVKERKLYTATVVNGPGNNFFDNRGIRSTSSVQESLPTSNADTAQGATLRVDLLGYIGGTYNVTVVLNGTTLGSITGSGVPTPMSGIFSVPMNLLVNSPSTNTVTLSESVSGMTSIADQFILTYRHSFFADDDALNFPVTPTQSLSVGGFSASARVIDITNPLNARELTVSQSASTIGITPPANTTRLYAFTDAKVLSPKQVLSDTPSNPDLRATSNQADLIVIAYADFKDAVQPLVTRRQQEGLGVFVTDVQNVFDEFGPSFGSHDPDAIRDFLQYAKNSWADPKPKYVLLVGDGNFDPRHYLATSNPDFVPTNFVSAAFSPEPPSDDSLADFNGDGVPELAVGRLPVRSAAETTTMASKIVTYASQAGSKTALLVSDNSDRNDYVFANFSQDLQTSSLVPNGVAVTRVDRPNYGTPNPPAGSDTPTHNAVMTEASKGPTIVNWFGHGAVQSWAGTPPLLQNSDVPSIANTGKLSLYLMMTCQNAYFVGAGATDQSLGEKLLQAASNGAIAVWGSSGDTVPYDQVNAAKVATQQLFSDPTKRLGDAMLAAKASISDLDVRHTWTLLGDPTTRLRIGAPTAVTLRSFTAARAARGIQVRWRTASEADVAGFNVYRFSAGSMVKVNQGLIAAQRVGLARGSSYRLVDTRVRRATLYTYRLEVVSLTGERRWAAAVKIRAAR